jgi:hypothetical protein
MLDVNLCLIFFYIRIFNAKFVIHHYIIQILPPKSDNFLQYLFLHPRMTSTNQKYSESYPKRPDITGSCEQAFGLGADLQTTIINSIRANTIAAIGIVAFGSLDETQFIFNPQVCTKPNGTPIAILGNASNKMGEFTLVSLSLALISLFPCVIRKEDNYILPHGMDIPSTLLADSTWQGPADTFVCVAVLNVVLFYFGQDIPQG